MLGKTLRGRYRIIRNLAAGGFGATFVAEDTDMPGHPPCVVKQLKPQSADPVSLQTARRLFDTEARVLYELGDRDQIPRLLAHFEENHQFYLVQELIEGQDLSRELAAVKCWSEETTIAFLLDVLNLLNFVHQKKVIHRDIKPSNIIRRASDGKFVLIDFGAVKQISSAAVDAGGNCGTTVAVGTPGYMPSEQASGHPQPCSDLYALGAIAIFALTGIHPQQLPRDPVSLEFTWRNRARVSPELGKIIDKMTRYHFSDRYQSAAEVLRELQALTKSPPSLFQKVSKLFFTPINELLSSAKIDEPSSSQLPTQPPLSAALKVETITLNAPPSAKIFISDRASDETASLARELSQALKAAGHQTFTAAETGQVGKNWPLRSGEELQQADCFIVLLSEQAASSELVTEQVRKAKEWRDFSGNGKPIIYPVRVSLPVEAPLNYELRGYLNQIEQRQWNSPADTPSLLREILDLLAAESAPTIAETAEELPSLPPTRANPNGIPQPAAEPELPEGQVELASVYYIERSPVEPRACQEINRAGALIRIKAPRQMGKTSLMARILHQAAQQNYKTVPLSLQLADAKLLTDLDRFLRWFCGSVGRRLRLPNRLSEMWDAEMFGSKDNCTAYFEEYLLPEIDAPLALGLDEVDRIFEHPEIADDFFGLLRAWHEEAKNRDIWKKLRLVVVHSTEVYIPMNVNQSPFNVGLPVELPEFTPEQVQDLAQRHGLNLSTQQIEQLMTMVGGHPYLVRLALYHIACREMTFEQVLQEAPTEAGLYRDHLRRFLWLIQQQSDLIDAFQQVAAAPDGVRLESRQAFRLQSMGLVHLQGNEVRLRCDLYRQYFGVTAKKQVQELAS